jgi:signal transduction histidine kinase
MPSRQPDSLSPQDADTAVPASAPNSAAEARADPEQRDQDRSGRVQIASSIGVVAGLFFAAFNLLTPGQALLGQIELAAVLLLAVPSWVISRKPARWAIAGHLLIACSFVIFGVLVILGGVAGTGLYWAFTVPFVAFFLKGQRTGWMVSVSFILLMSAYVWLLTPDRLLQPEFTLVYPHGREELMQFSLALVFYSVMAAMFNQAIRRRTRELRQANATTRMANTALQASSLELVEQNKTIDRILSTASHDLRQPMHALGLLSAGLRPLAKTPAEHVLVQDVTSSIEAMQEMLKAYFEYSWFSAHGQALSMGAVSVDALFAQLGRWFHDKSRQKTLRLVIKPCGAWVHSDALLLQRVLLNLMSNAVRYTERGGILLCARRTTDGRQLRIQVRDSGIGIAPDEQRNIFNEFYQVGNQARSANLGLGLGLSVAHQACMRLGHALTLRSSPGRGSTFTLLLDLTEAPSPAEQAEQADTVLPHPLILVIEDERHAREGWRQLIPEWGYAVQIAASAHEALQALDPAAPPAFIISDYRLVQGVYGLEAIALLRDKARHPIPACLVSGDSGSEVLRLAQEAGLPLLTKPVAPAKLRKLLRTSLS